MICLMWSVMAPLKESTVTLRTTPAPSTPDFILRGHLVCRTASLLDSTAALGPSPIVRRPLIKRDEPKQTLSGLLYCLWEPTDIHLLYET